MIRNMYIILKELFLLSGSVLFLAVNGRSQDKQISHYGMVLIKGGTFNMGGDNEQADKDEFPKHR